MVEMFLNQFQIITNGIKIDNMEIETLNTKPPFSKDKRSLNSSSFTFDLPSLIENMKHSHTWAKGELNALILLKSPDKQIVLTALHEEYGN